MGLLTRNKKACMTDLGRWLGRGWGDMNKHLGGGAIKMHDSVIMKNPDFKNLFGKNPNEGFCHHMLAIFSAYVSVSKPYVPF